MAKYVVFSMVFFHGNFHACQFLLSWYLRDDLCVGLAGKTYVGTPADPNCPLHVLTPPPLFPPNPHVVVASACAAVRAQPILLQ